MKMETEAKTNEAIPEEEDDHHPERQPFIGQGIIADFRRTVGTHWCSELKVNGQNATKVRQWQGDQGVNPVLSIHSHCCSPSHALTLLLQQILAVSFFLFIAVIAPSITFGAGKTVSLVPSSSSWSIHILRSL